MDVLLLSNDLVPGMEVPVAAPGLRQFGLAQGLREHGHQVTLVVPRGVTKRVWSDMPPPSTEGTLIIPAGELRSLLESRQPCAVVLTNSNQFDVVSGIEGVRYVYDFFAPKVLELVCHHDSDEATDTLASLRERKIRALAAADAVLVNGSKKRGYAYAWLLQTDREVMEIPVLETPMCLRMEPPAERTVEPPVRVGIAGYLQQWSLPGPWLNRVAQVLEETGSELHVLLPTHWGGGAPVEPSPALRELLVSDRVVQHDSKSFDDFVVFLQSLDVVLDLFEPTLEREFAMVTRTVVALAAGRPVIHPTFTEVSAHIAEAEAGWLLDVTESDSLVEGIRQALADPKELERRAANAHHLASTTFDPRTATSSLAALLSSWEG